MHVNLVFPAPGFFVTEARLVVRLAELELYEGSFTTGFESELELSPGRYVLDTQIDGPMLGRAQHLDLVLEPDDVKSGYRHVPFVVATLRYSRLFGAFKRQISILAR